MVKRIREYIKYTQKELEEYTKTKDSCVYKINKSMHIGFPPYGLTNFKETILNIIAYQKIGLFDSKLQGITLDVRNIKVLGDTGALRADDPTIHINIHADCYVFKPQIGAIIRGIVKHISASGSCLIGVIIYRVFSVSIKLQNHDAKKNIQINSEIEFRIKDFDLKNSMPFIEGELTAKEEELPSTRKNKKNQLDNEESEISDDDLSSAKNEKQIIFQNVEEEEHYGAVDDSDAENVDIFNTQETTKLISSQHSRNAEESQKSDKEVELLTNEIHSFDVEYDEIEQNNSGLQSNNFNSLLMNIKQETETLTTTVDDIRSNLGSIKEEGENLEYTQRISHKKKKDQNKKLPNEVSPLMVEIKTETISPIKEFKRERYTWELPSLSSSIDSVLAKIITENDEFKDAHEQGEIRNEQQQINHQNATREEVAQLSKENEINSTQEIEVNLDSELNGSYDINSKEKKISKKKSTNIFQKLNTSVSTTSIEATQSASLMLSNDLQNSTTIPKKKNKSKKKKRSLDESILNILSEIKKEKQQKEEVTVEQNSILSQSDTHTDCSSTKSKKKKKKSKLDESLSEILSTLNTRKSNQLSQSKIRSTNSGSGVEKQTPNTQISIDSTCDFDSTSTLNSISNDRKKKNKKNNLNNLIQDILSTIKTEKENSSSLNNETVQEVHSNNCGNSIQNEKSSSSKKKSKKKSIDNLTLNILNEIKTKKHDDTNNNANVELKNNVLDKINKKKNLIDDGFSSESSVQSKLKRKRKNSINDSILMIIAGLSSPVVPVHVLPSQEMVNETSAMIKNETSINAFSSPLLSSTMINPKKRRKEK